MCRDTELYDEKDVATREEDVGSASSTGYRDGTAEGPEPGVTLKTWIVIFCMMVGFVSHFDMR